MSIGGGKVVERCVDSLQEIYAVVIALAISQAIQSLLKPAAGTGGVSLQSVYPAIPAFIAFLVTLVPFWHGMNRHLDRCYLEKSSGVVQQALILDFGVFLLEACFLFAAGWSLKFGTDTFYCLGGLLAVDMIWSLVSHLIHFRERKSHALKWSLINLVAIAAAFFVITYQFDPKPLVLMAIALLRSIADYWIGIEFYFPGPSTAHSA